MVNDSSCNDKIARRRVGLVMAVPTCLLLIGVATAAISRWGLVPLVATLVGTVAGAIGSVVGACVAAEIARASIDRAECARRDAEHARARAEMRTLRLAGSMEPIRAESLLARQDG
jgi:hypothetical protein